MLANPRFSLTKTFCNKDSKHWNKIFRKYTECTDLFIQSYTAQYDHADAPYWNIERSNIGMLATACWLNGWIALEEFSTDKVEEDNSTNNGRCDLWISSKKGKHNYAIEAKKGSCSLDSNNMIEKLENILKHACNDANKLDDEGDNHMGIAFMHFYLNKKNKQVYELSNSTLMNIETYFENNQSKIDFIYIYLKDNGVESDTSIIPGIVIAGKVVS